VIFHIHVLCCCIYVFLPWTKKVAEVLWICFLDRHLVNTHWRSQSQLTLTAISIVIGRISISTKRKCSFLPGISLVVIFIARQHTDARYWYNNSVRPSVCPSVRDTLVLYENGLTYLWRPLAGVTPVGLTASWSSGRGQVSGAARPTCLKHSVWLTSLGLSVARCNLVRYRDIEMN